MKEKSNSIKDLDDMVNKWHDPDLLFFYIKHIYNESQKGISDNDLPIEKRDLVNVIYKLDVFRATMQYLEEFGIYFISYITNPSEISKKLIKTEPKDVKEFYNALKNNNHDDFSNKKKSLEYNDLLKEVFAYDIIPRLNINSEEISNEDIPKMVDESVFILRKKIDKFSNFYLKFLELYNAIKHGTRVFPHKIDSLVIYNPQDIKIKIEEDYITAICKNREGNLYQLEQPVNVLIEDSMNISAEVNEIFSYLRTIIKYKVSNPEKVTLKFFKSVPSVKESKKGYLKVHNQDQVMYIPESSELDDFIEKPFTATIAINMVLSNKILYLHTKQDLEISHKYPVLIKIKASASDTLAPMYISEHNLKFNIVDMDVKQYRDLVNLKILKNGLKGIVLVDDNKNKNIGPKFKPEGFDFSDVPIIHPKKVIEFLSKLQLITNERIPLPLNISINQELLIRKNIDKSFSKQNEAKIFVSELKNSENINRCTKFKIKITNNDDFLFSKDLGTIMGDWAGFKIQESNQYEIFREKVYGNPNAFVRTEFKNIKLNPNAYIKMLEAYIKDPLNVDYPKIDPKIVNKSKIIFDVFFYYTYGKPEFWYQNHFVEIELKILP